MILMGLKKDCKPEDLAKVIEEQLGTLKKFKNKNNEYVSLELKIPNSINPVTKTTSAYTIFTFVDQNNNQKFLDSYQTNEKLNQFKDTELYANYKINRKDLNSSKIQMGKNKTFKKPQTFRKDNIKNNAIYTNQGFQQFQMQQHQCIQPFQQQHPIPLQIQQQQAMYNYCNQSNNRPYPRTYQQELIFNPFLGANLNSNYIQQGSYQPQIPQMDYRIQLNSYSTPNQVPEQSQMYNQMMNKSINTQKQQ
eukprot:TRINITY_DN6238_c0_g1_i3.p1 TRINITY_DN6238_c0_g1~~TRINITY_DN6238_c0_g1_i3.p1  ORF type:complete len:249 (-),score=45.14 TRINITY_DN6238_c0_g1_i3:287-1033(-)